MAWRRLFGREGEPEQQREQAPAPDALERVRAYHQLTKHDLHAYARGPGYLEWDSQPAPFRRWEGAPLVTLPQPQEHEISWEEVLGAAPREPAPFDLETLSRLLVSSLGVSGWKQAGESTWALRANPSSGNLHPTELHLILPALAGVSTQPCVAHYAAREHGLELRTQIDLAQWSALAPGLGARGCLLVLSSILWRESWKYGERAYRYCQHDVGHALGALAVAAAGLGYELWAQPAIAAEELQRGLRLPAGELDQGAEPEEPDLLLVLAPRGDEPTQVAPEALRSLADSEWSGAPSLLSSEHERWELAESAAALCAPAAPSWSAEESRERRSWTPGGPQNSLWPLVRSRRSAVAMDGKTRIARASFLRMLRATLDGPAAHAATGPSARVDLALFVHRVEGLEPGLYLLPRDRERVARLRAALRPEFLFEAVAHEAGDFELLRLHAADLRGLASRLACQQEIAGAGAFSVAMLADLDLALEQDGPAGYARLHWECGWIGQMLYLEAWAHGVSATGIGCFFDDPSHAVLGLRDRALQVLYHFTVGGAVLDERVSDLPAYPAPTSV